MTKNQEDLQINGYQIYQSDDYFRFGQDSVLLANFIVEQYKKKFDNKIKASKHVTICDMCSGTAIIPLLLHAKLLNRKNVKEKSIENNNEKNTENKKINLKILAVEIEKEIVDLAKESLKLNANVILENEIEILNDDIKNIFLKKEKYSKLYHSFDIVCANPPYVKMMAGLKNDKESLLLARAEYKCDFDDVCNSASKLLQTKGSFFIIHKTQRLPELIVTMKKYKLEPKYIKFIHSNIKTSSQNFLLEAVKEAGEELTVSPPMIISE